VLISFRSMMKDEAAKVWRNYGEGVKRKVNVISARIIVNPKWETRKNPGP